MEVVPTSEPGVWLVIKKSQDGNNADEEKHRPVSDEPAFDGAPRKTTMK